MPLSASSRYLREADRIHITDRLRERATVRAIAAELGRSPSTVSPEIRRNPDRTRPQAAAPGPAPTAPLRRAHGRDQ
ncbi:helix-turn-helix domain-containing protein [Streptomyces sp. NPDC091268]|uniref:helix-turn-helix domain-containing protein n=1 Tax=Streptomyces sp. NPDC091268 TaxID=3365979 RepID=UPI003807B578